MKRGMGFCDLEDFNKTLLAKQLRHIVTNPGSLVASILREKYCKTGNLMTECVKGQFSLLWRSLMAVRKVLELGTRWRVGDGSKIKIWSDKWLPTQGTFQVQSPNKQLPMEATMKELIKDDGSAWNEELIKNIFWEEEAKAILSIPLGRSGRVDEIIWALTEMGSLQ